MIKERTQSPEPGSFFLCPFHLKKRAFLFYVELIGLYIFFNYYLTTSALLHAIIIGNFASEKG
jgi:hypothetical protein